MDQTITKKQVVLKEYPKINSVYKHYKGGEYKVLCMAKHSESNEDLVIYQSVQFFSIHARPLKMWFDTVQMAYPEGEPIHPDPPMVNRFELINT